MNGIVFENDKIYLKNVLNFDLEQTLDCGQAFRWQKDKNGVWHGIVGDKLIKLHKSGKDIVIEGSNKEDFCSLWNNYFDLDRDYRQIIDAVSLNEKIKVAAQYSSGIRILNQDPWETLCSFIISQNNNIPRIKGIIERLCENFGKKIENRYTFPSAKALSDLSVEDLAPIRSGFRAKYIIDAAQKVDSGEIVLNDLKTADFNAAREKLMTIKGVGPKVADCVLLFGLGHIEAFPRDVWIKRAMEKMFDGNLPECAIKYAGIVQQYIFYYIRNNFSDV